MFILWLRFGRCDGVGLSSNSLILRIFVATSAVGRPVILGAVAMTVGVEARGGG
jgi:hypothetical protein